MAKRKTPARKAEPATMFESDRYNSFATWQKVVFWIGIISWLSAVYWIVRLIIFLVLQNKPKTERVDAYAMQTYVFGWIDIVAIILVVLFLLWLIPMVMVATTVR
jgi:uncharacterized membrane protein